MIYILQGKICQDYCVSIWCCPCALCQIRREWNHVIRYRGHRIGHALIKERVY